MTLLNQIDKNNDIVFYCFLFSYLISSGFDVIMLGIKAGIIRHISGVFSGIFPRQNCLIFEFADAG